MENIIIINSHYLYLTAVIVFIVTIVTRLIWDLFLPRIQKKHKKELETMFNLGLYEGGERENRRMQRDNSFKETTFEEYEKKVKEGTLFRWP